MSESTETNRKSRVWPWRRVLIAMCLCLPASALWAQITPVLRLRMERPNASQLETAVSGRSTDGNLLQIDRVSPLYQLGTTEYLDRPGGVTARFFAPQWDHEANGWDLQVGHPAMRRSWTAPNINLPAGQTSSMEANIYEGAPRGETRFVRGVAVCPSSGFATNNDRIKGIRLYWGKVPPGATSSREITTRPNDYVQFRRANCNENNGWLPAQMCASGRVATGVKVHRSNDGAVGIQLLCDHLALMTDEEGRTEFARLNPGGSFGGTRPSEPSPTPAFPDRPSELPLRPGPRR